MNSFSKGFSKKAGDNFPLALIGGLVGGLASRQAGKAYMNKRNNEEAKSMWSMAKEQHVDAKKLFNSIKKELPENTVLVTGSTLNALSKKEKDPIKKQVIEYLKHYTKDNAASMDQRYTSAFRKHIPKEFAGQNLIITADKVAPSVLLHEAGHVVDFEDIRNKDFLSRSFIRAFRPKYMSEVAAWDKAPGKIDDRIKDVALRSYRRGYYPEITGALGAAAGLTLGLILDLKR